MKKLLTTLALASLFCIPVLAQDVPRAEIYGGPSLVFSDLTWYGFQAAAELNLNEKVGIVADFGFLTRSNSFTNATFMAGPRFSFRGEKARVFVHGLVGGLYRGYFEETELIIAPGGGVDIPFNKYMSIRPAQIDLILWMTPDFGVDFRYSGGVVFKLGSID